MSPFWKAFWYHTLACKMYSDCNPVISTLTIYPKEVIIQFRKIYMYKHAHCSIADNIENLETILNVHGWVIGYLKNGMSI